MSLPEAISFDLPALLDIQDIRRIAKVGTNQAYAIAHAAGPIKLGRAIRVRPQDLAAYLERLRAGEVEL